MRAEFVENPGEFLAENLAFLGTGGRGLDQRSARASPTAGQTSESDSSVV